ncbi:MAG: hypothetical protein AB7F59_11495 [Bdellovibrionales bacterium]
MLKYLFFTALITCFTLQVQAAPFTKNVADITNDELLALYLLRGTTLSGIFESEKVSQIVQEIAAIRASYPEAKNMGDMNAIKNRFSQFHLYLDGTQSKNLVTDLKKMTGLDDNSKGFTQDIPIQGDLTKYDIPELLSFIAGSKASVFFSGGVAEKAYPTEKPTVLAIEANHITYKFSYMVDTDTLVKSLDQYPGLERASNGLLPGNGDTVSRIEKSPEEVAYTYVNRVGDCPAGCGVAGVYSFLVNPKTGAVVKR